MTKATPLLRATQQKAANTERSGESMYYQLPSQFCGVKQGASNVSTDKGNYSVVEFQRDFPQFFDSDGNPLAPASMMELFITTANETISPSKWGNQAEYCAGLFVAHRLTMYLRTFSESSPNAQTAAASGALVGVVRSATIGDASISYDTSALTSATNDWGDLNATQYGQILASIARMIGMAGSYAI